MTDQVYSNTAEGGTNGTAVSTGNSGGASGTAFATVQTGTQWTFSTAAAKPSGGGSLGYNLALDTTSRYLRGDDPSPSGRGGMGSWFEYTGAPSATLFLGQIRDSAVVAMCSAVITTAGKFSCSNTSSTLQTGMTSPSALSAGWYRYEILATPGGTTSTGTVEIYLWDSSGTLVHSNTVSGTFNLGSTLPPSAYRFGSPTGPITNYTNLHIDNLRWGHVASGNIGDVANAAPTQTLSATQTVSAGAACTATSTASDSDGSIASYLWTVVTAASSATPTLTNATTATVSFTAPAAGNLVTLQCVVTDNQGATNTATTEVRVPTTSDVSTLSFVGTGDSGWTIIGGAGSEGAALNDASNTTRMESPDIVGTDSVRTWRLAPMTARSGLRITLLGAVLTSSIANSNKVRVISGGTQITERATTTLKKVSDNSTSDVTTSDLDLYFDLTGPEIAAISDWGDVRVSALVH
jgi:hypothetical protein